MITRSIQPVLERLVEAYPVVTITGPRQAGKTTLCRMTFPQAAYVSLESIDNRQFALNDPRGFLARYKSPVIIDEIQRAPDLPSYIQSAVDDHNESGQFILTGSAQFELLHAVNQSLAGRTAILKLLPFTLNEAWSHRDIPDLDTLMWTGFYPRIHDKQLNASEALRFYVETYIQRDVRDVLQIRDLAQFERFVMLCAGRTGQILNMSNLGNDCGVSHNTVRSWLSVLEASYIIFLLRPHHNNLNKRLVKAPKLYFTDVGLATNLLGIDSPRQLTRDPLRGALFETYVVSEFLKHRFNRGDRSNLYYFRDNVGHEVDLLLDYGRRVFAIEIKSGQTVAEDYFDGLDFYRKINPSGTFGCGLVHGGDDAYQRSGVHLANHRTVDDLFAWIESNARC